MQRIDFRKLFLVGIVMLLFNCANNELEVKALNHLDGSNYTLFSNSQVDATIIYTGTVKSIYKDDVVKFFKWAILTNNDGELGGLYLGSESFDKNSIVKITKSEWDIEVARCKKEAADVMACYDDLMKRTIDDCKLAGRNPSDPDCWYCQGNDACDE